MAPYGQKSIAYFDIKKTYKRKFQTCYTESREDSVVNSLIRYTDDDGRSRFPGFFLSNPGEHISSVNISVCLFKIKHLF